MISIKLLVVLVGSIQICCCKARIENQSRSSKFLFFVANRKENIEEIASEKMHGSNWIVTDQFKIREEEDKLTNKNAKGERQEHLMKRIKRTVESKRNNLEQHGSGKNKERNSYPFRKHACKTETHPNTSYFSYQCKPSYLWSSEITVDEKIRGNKTLFETSEELYSQIHEFYFTQDVVAISDAVNRWKIPHNITILQLQKQNIRILKRRPFLSLEDTLVILRLDSNVIIHIFQSVFTGLQNLEELDLSYNHLHFLHRRLFSALGQLKTLKLNHNQLEFIGEMTLACLGSLSYLDLSNNVLTDVHENAFRQLKDSRSIVINLRRNRLSQPRSGWLLVPQSSESCPGQKTFNFTNILVNSSESTLRTRILWGDENPWQCSCGFSYETLAFLETLILLRHSRNNKLFGKYCSYKKAQSCFLKQQDLYQVRWDLKLPCSDLEPQWGYIDLGFTIQAAIPVYNSCCSISSKIQEPNVLVTHICHYLSKWIKNNVRINGTNDDFGLTYNQVTIIGIIIVVVSPILLTLCPDCNKKRNVSNHHMHENPNIRLRRENNRSNFLFIRRFSKMKKAEEKT